MSEKIHKPNYEVENLKASIQHHVDKLKGGTPPKVDDYLNAGVKVVKSESEKKDKLISSLQSEIDRLKKENFELKGKLFDADMFNGVLSESNESKGQIIEFNSKQNIDLMKRNVELKQENNNLKEGVKELLRKQREICQRIYDAEKAGLIDGIIGPVFLNAPEPNLEGLTEEEVKETI